MYIGISKMGLNAGIKPILEILFRGLLKCSPHDQVRYRSRSREIPPLALDRAVDQQGIFGSNDAGY